MQDFFPIWDCKHISPLSSLFLPDLSSAYCLCKLLSFLHFRISALQGFTSGYILLVLHVLEWTRLEQNTIAALPLNMALHFVFYYRFNTFLDICCALHPKKLFLSFSRTFCDYQDFFKIPGQFKDKLHFFRILGVFQDQGHFPGIFKVCEPWIS